MKMMKFLAGLTAGAVLLGSAVVSGFVPQASLPLGQEILASAEETSGTCGDDLTWTLDDGTLTISGTGEMEDYSSSSYVPWYSSRTSVTTIVIQSGVTSIGTYAFSECTSLTYVTIPDSVTGIGSDAFKSCTSLTSVTIPDSVTSIGDYAFYKCASLISIIVDENNENYSSIDGVLFNKSQTDLIWCPAAKVGEYIIPDSVTIIYGHAFDNCTSLTGITIGNSVTTICAAAIYFCTNLTSITIGNSVAVIGSYAFDGCASLTSITIPDSVTIIWNGVFYACTSLTSIVVDENNENYSSIDGVLFNKSQTELMCYPEGKEGEYIIPDSVTSIVDCAFFGCASLTSVTIPDSVTSIVDSAFSGCTSLTSVNIPDGVTSIGSQTFYECTSLTNVTIPDSVTSIEEQAFIGCTSLTDVYYSGTEEEWNEIEIGSSNDCLTSATIHYGEEAPSTTTTTTEPTTTTTEAASDIEGSITLQVEDVSITASEDEETEFELEVSVIADDSIDSSVDRIFFALELPDATANLVQIPDWAVGCEDNALLYSNAGFTSSIANISSYLLKYKDGDTSAEPWIYAVLESNSAIEVAGETVANICLAIPTNDEVISIAEEYGLTLQEDESGTYYEFPVDFAEQQLIEKSTMQGNEVVTIYSNLHQYLQGEDDLFDSDVITITLSGGTIRVYVTEETSTTTTTTAATIETTTTTTTTESRCTSNTTTTTAEETTTTTTATESEATTTTIAALMYGDITGNQTVDLADFVFLTHYITGSVVLNDYTRANADVNVDGYVDADDAIVLLKYMVNLITILPYTD